MIFAAGKFLKLFTIHLGSDPEIVLPHGRPAPRLRPGRRKRMKFSKFGRPTLAAVLSLGATAMITACGRTGYNNTVDYVYVTNSKNNPGEINVFYADGDAGSLTQISDSPYPTGGRNPVGLVTSPN